VPRRMNQPRASTSLGFSKTSVSPLGRRNVRPRSILSHYSNSATRGIAPNFVPRPEECFRKPPPPPLPGQAAPSARSYNYSLRPTVGVQTERFVCRFRRESPEEFKTGVAQYVSNYVRDGESVLRYQPRDWDVYPAHQDWKIKRAPQQNIKVTGDGAMWGRFDDRLDPGALRGCPDITTSKEHRTLPRATVDGLARFQSPGAARHKYYALTYNQGAGFFKQSIVEPVESPREHARETRRIMKDFEGWSHALTVGGHSLNDTPLRLMSATTAPIKCREKLRVFDGTHCMRDESGYERMSLSSMA